MADQDPTPKPRGLISRLAPWCVAILATGTLLLQNGATFVQAGTGFLKEIPGFIRSAKEAVNGPELQIAPLPLKKVGVSDGGTSDGTKAFAKSSGACMVPLNGGELVPDAGGKFGQFVPTSQSNPARATFEVTANTPEQYCVRVTAATGDKRVREVIEGELHARERFVPQHTTS